MRKVRFAGRIFSVVLCSGVVGLGIGFLQGELLYRGEIRVAEMAFAESAAVVGAEVALLLGPLLYYGLHRQKVSFEMFATVVSATATVAILSGLFLVVMGWTTLFLTTIAAIVTAVLAES
jgi:hypothetical protein